MLLDQISIHSWIKNNAIKTETGQPIDFYTHRFLFDIYKDDAKYIVCEKAAQIGFTTFEILNSFWTAYNRGYDIIYVLPTATDVKDFAGGKVNRIIDQNLILQQWCKDKDSVEQKRVGKSTIYYRGSWSDRAALMISADWLILDEYDRSKQEILEMYESRLQHSKIGKKSIFSNPSAPDFGVDKYYKQSDQKRWFIKHNCGQTYEMDETCIDFATERYVCPKCLGLISSECIRLGEWTPTSSGEWSGYRIPLWIYSVIPASKICEYKRTKGAEYFANFVAGMPYIGSGNTVQAGTIVKCLSNTINDQTDRIIIGVDTGLPIHYVLGNKQGIFHYGKCSDPSTGRDPYDELEAMLKRWSNSIIIADQGGDLIGIRKLQAKYPGRVFLVWYRADAKGTEMIKWGTDMEYGKVTADRNRLIQIFIDEMVDKRVTFQGTESDWQEYITHWLNIYRVWEKDDAGIIDKTKGFKWERQGPDHLVHATIYCRIGMDKYADSKAKIINTDFQTGIASLPFDNIIGY